MDAEEEALNALLDQVEAQQLQRKRSKEGGEK
jgi:hypothetical protein